VPDSTGRAACVSFNIAVPEVTAENAYLFRHALLRDVAYELQLPVDRARLHAMTFALIEDAFGGRPPEAPPLDSPDEQPIEPHATDRIAHELAWHAMLAETDDNSFVDVQRLYLRRAAENASGQFKSQQAAGIWQSLAVLLEGSAQGEALRRGAVEYHQYGAVERAERGFERALATQRQVGNRRFEGVALANLASLYHLTGRIEQAERGYEQALAILREVGNRSFEGITLGNLGTLHQLAGRTEQAERVYEQALATLREVGNRRGEGATLGNIAGVYQVTGRIDRAEHAHAQALAIHREVGNRRSEGITLGNLANLYTETARMVQAESTFELALAINRQVGNRRFEGLVLCNYGMCLLVTGRRAEARKRWQEGAAILRELHDDTELERHAKTMRKACAKDGIEPFNLPEAGATDRHSGA
jgi:tetratricopeptide (TPR) repeat protein